MSMKGKHSEPFMSMKYGRTEGGATPIRLMTSNSDRNRKSFGDRRSKTLKPDEQ